MYYYTDKLRNSMKLSLRNDSTARPHKINEITYLSGYLLDDLVVGVQLIELIFEIVTVLNVVQHQRVHVHCPLISIRCQSFGDALAFCCEYLNIVEV